MCEDHRAFEDWLTYRWGQVQGIIINNALLHSRDLLELIDRRVAFDDELSRRCDEKIGHMISKAIAGKPWQYRAMREAAIAVCPDRARLLKEITADDAVRGLKPGIKPVEALGRILKNHLHARRWEALGRSEHKDRVWTILLEHDRKVKEDYRKTRREPPPDPCSDEHFMNIQRSIQKDIQAGEYNGRVKSIKLGTIRDYFFEFCRQCRALASQEYERSRRTEPWNHGAMPSFLRERMAQALEACIEYLDEPERSIIDASLEPDEGAAYRERERMDAGEFRRRREKAICRLRACLKRRLGSEE